MARRAVRLGVIGYLAIVLLGPLAMVLWRTFGSGLGPVWAALVSGGVGHAVYLTLLITAITVPVNTIFGVAFAIALVRHKMPLGRLASAIVDLPLGLCPVVVGLALYILYGRGGWFGTWLLAHNVRVLFALPSMVLATVFVTVPFVAREVVPLLRALGDDQEQAAATLGATPFQIFRRITLPSIRSAVEYGMVLTAAFALGEYGAMSIVSGSILGVTETLTIHIQTAYDSLDVQGAYVSAVILLALAAAILVAMNVLRPKEASHVHRGA
jgi:sulfate/thiosulfate transport system permease protein